MANQPVRIGIVGCGDVMAAYMFHIQQLAGQGLAQVTWVCDLEASKAENAASRYHIPRFTTRYQELVESPEVDLVLVITSMKAHSAVAAAGLQAGKHVLVEKPLAVDLQQAAELVALSKRSAGYLLCAPFVVLSPTYQAIWKRLQRGDIGQVLTARARYGHAGPTWGPWYYQQGGGVLFDLAPYNLASLTGWLGPVQRVAALAGTAIPVRNIDGAAVQVAIEDNAHVLLDFGKSVYAVVTAGFTMQQYRCPAIELYGSQGTLQMMGDDWDPDGYELFLNQSGAWTIYKETDPGWLWTDGIRHLVHCILSGTPPIIPPEHAYHVLEIMIRAKQAAQDGCTRQVASVFPPYAFEDVKADAENIHLVHDRTHQRQ